MSLKARLSIKALKKLLKPKEKEIKAQGYESIEEFIGELKKVPLEDALAFKDKLKKENNK